MYIARIKLRTTKTVDTQAAQAIFVKDILTQIVSHYSKKCYILEIVKILVQIAAKINKALGYPVAE